MAEIGWIAAGGFLGAMARYAMVAFVSARWPTRLPLGTLLVNLIGSFLLGWIASSGLNEQIAFFLGTGFMGGVYDVLHVQAGEREPVSVGRRENKPSVHGDDVPSRHRSGMAGIWCGNVTY